MKIDKNKKSMTIKEVAKLLGKSEMFVRIRHTKKPFTFWNSL